MFSFQSSLTSATLPFFRRNSLRANMRISTVTFCVLCSGTLIFFLIIQSPSNYTTFFQFVPISNRNNGWTWIWNDTMQSDWSMESWKKVELSTNIESDQISTLNFLKVENSTSKENFILNGYKRKFSNNISEEKSRRNMDEDWLVVKGRRLLVKSAYVDLSVAEEVRILANKHCLENRTVKCYFQSAYYKDYQVTEGLYDLINSPVGTSCSEDKYESFYIVCPLARGPGELALFRPTELTIFASDHDPSIGSNLTISYVPKFDHQLAVCIPPLFSWGDTHRLSLFVEYYIYQGADYFLIYNHSSTDEVSVLLNEYQKRGLLDIVQWHQMPMVTNDSLNKMSNYHGQILSMNDCLWKLRGKVDYVTLVDVDELILPLSSNYTNLLDLLKKNDHPQIGGFMFQSSFTYTNWPSSQHSWDPTNLRKVFNFTELIALREEKIYRPTVRSKVIVKPKRIIKQTVHQVWVYAPGFTRKVISSEDALLYHIRPFNRKPENVIIDDTEILRNIFENVTGR